MTPKKPCLTKSPKPKPPNPTLATKKPLLTKSPKPNPETACRVPKRKPAYYPKNSAQAEFWSFCAFAEKTQCLRQKLIAKAAKVLVGMTGFGT